MIKVVNEMNDFEMRIGAMILVSEGMFKALFEVMKRDDL
jgi:hypothetical protein